MTALRKVLVVDDDPVIGKSFDRVLTGKGYAVITAANGEEALKKLGAEDYDVVYTDIKMPGMNGLEVAEKVKARKPWTPVVIITGYGTAEHEARARAAGATRFLHKPLSPAMIEGSAREALETAAPAPVPAPASAPAEAAVEPVRRENIVKSIALFFASPFIGLAYLVAFPFVASAMLAWVATEAAMKNAAFRNTSLVLRNVAMLAVAPLIGLASIVVLPFVGLAMLAWLATRGLIENGKVR